tara:strand:- start:3 stop:176 length:174 start_codon:yes stop_codon:yes gene_type:complete
MISSSIKYPKALGQPPAKKPFRSMWFLYDQDMPRVMLVEKICQDSFLGNAKSINILI